MGITRNNGAIEYTGLVLGERHGSYDLGYETTYHALVWDWNTMRPIEVHCGCTRSTIERIEVDATPQVLECYNIYLHNMEVYSIIRRYDMQYHAPHRDFGVKVKRGRLVPIGTTGIVKHTYQTDFGLKLILVDEYGKEHKTYAKNVEVTYIPLSYSPKCVYKSYPKLVQSLYQAA